MTAEQKRPRARGSLVATAARRRAEAELAFRDAVIAAHARGESLRSIAAEAGLSHVRILQLVREGDLRCAVCGRVHDRAVPCEQVR
jgi:hypothetical protein